MNTLVKAVTCFLGLMSPILVSAQEIKPVNGTWINLPYQDVRNKYMNPLHVGDANPFFWKAKLAEYAEMGMEYIVIMAVANEEKAYYPSSFMKPVFAPGTQSQVEAIMEAAEKHNLKVFMSCGWAKDQDDDIRKPEIKIIQQKIMQETAALFGKSPAFYGWYLPVEDSLDPYLPEASVIAVNALTEAAKALTPQAKVMVSPYGIVHADLKDPKFAEQIKKLKVDIIAYQDEIGCVREPLPMARMKENFKLLGEIHKQTNISFWANVESFTWEKAPNSRESALIPASFPRYLSQIVGTSLAGAENVISFSVYGMFDKQDSPMPIGQPIYAAKAYQDFMDWKAKKGRWPVLEQSFTGKINQQRQIKSIHSTGATLSSDNSASGATKTASNSSKQLIDGQFGAENTQDINWIKFANGQMEIKIDLGSSQSINNLGIRFLNYSPQKINMPSMVDFYASTDGKNYTKMSTYQMPEYPNDLHDAWIDMAYIDQLKISARYIKILAQNTAGTAIMTDEIIINALNK